ncbi:septum formation family protein, partial [Mycobacterium kansasii]
MAPVDCLQPHKFEVAGEPARSLPENAPYPTQSVIAAQRDQLCPPVVTEYLGTRLDPKGRFQMGLLAPGEKAW